MHLFYTNDIRGDLAFLHEEEAKHCALVLRHRVGDEIQWVDGRGGYYQGSIVEMGKKSCVLKAERREHMGENRPWRLTLAVAPTKNMDRTEWLLEKAVEVGMDAFVPLLCERSERKNIRHDRLEKIAVSAMKQSLRAWLPEIYPMMPFKDFVVAQTGNPAQLFIAHCMEDQGKSLLQHNFMPGRDVCILIGPEGDFSEEEVLFALRSGFVAASLGRYRLRTETAALAAVQIAHFVNN